MKVTIFQQSKGDFIQSQLGALMGKSIAVQGRDYQAVYLIEDIAAFSERQITEETPYEEVLDYLFYVFNVEHPEDYRARSMSVSDVVEINQERYVCEGIGWRKVS